MTPPRALNATAARARWREHVRAGATAGAPALRVGLAATFTAEPFLPLLGTRLLELGFSPSLSLAPFNQLFQVCLDPEAHLGRCDVIVLAWRIEDLMDAEAVAALESGAGDWEPCLEKVRLLESAVRSLCGRFAGSVVLSVPPSPSGLPAGPLELRTPFELGALHRAVTEATVRLAERVPGVRLWDLDTLQRQHGQAEADDLRQWYLYRQPFSDRFLLGAADLLARLLAAGRRPPRKCLVVDADNTLWGGIVGEDGVEGLQLGEEFPGSAYRDLQRMLLHWRAQGVLLAIASKNNEGDVWEVFDRHSGMLLRREHFAAWRIDWQSKQENVRLLAGELNLGLESFVFLDDNPVEIEAMRQAVPEVLSVLLPPEPEDILPTLRALTCFDRLEVTREDRARTELMQAERQRRDAGATMGPEEFLASLELKVRVFRAEPADLERIAQLINKTNQFNLTTRRRTLDEVRALAASPDYRIYGVQVADRFGDYGLTGAVVAELDSREGRWTLDTFLLSCRVLGRRVETAVLAAFASAAEGAGAREIVAHFIPSPKNAVAAEFLPGHGFRRGHAPGEWRAAPREVAPIPPGVECSVVLGLE